MGLILPASRAVLPSKMMLMTYIAKNIFLLDRPLCVGDFIGLFGLLLLLGSWRMSIYDSITLHVDNNSCLFILFRKRRMADRG